MNEPNIDLAAFTIKADELFEQRVFTHFGVGEIVNNIPVELYEEGGKSFWQYSTTRPHAFFGRCKLNANGKIIPIQFAIPATSLPEAIELFPSCVKEVVNQMHSQAIRQTLIQGSPRNSQLDLSKLKS